MDLTQLIALGTVGPEPRTPTNVVNRKRKPLHVYVGSDGNGAHLVDRVTQTQDESVPPVALPQLKQVPYLLGGSQDDYWLSGY